LVEEPPRPQPGYQRQRMRRRPGELQARERLVGGTARELLAAEKGDLARVARALVGVVGGEPEPLPEPSAGAHLVPADRGRGHVLGADDALRVLDQDDEVVDLVVEVSVLESGVGERPERRRGEAEAAVAVEHRLRPEARGDDDDPACTEETGEVWLGRVAAR